MPSAVKMVAAKSLDHGDNPILTWMAGNCIADQDPQGAIKPSRKNSREKIDGIAALVQETGADELIVVSDIYDHPTRLRSFEMIAEAAK